MHVVIIQQFFNTQNIHDRFEIVKPEIQMSNKVALLITQHVFIGAQFPFINTPLGIYEIINK